MWHIWRPFNTEANGEAMPSTHTHTHISDVHHIWNLRRDLPPPRSSNGPWRGAKRDLLWSHGQTWYSSKHCCKYNIDNNNTLINLQFTTNKSYLILSILSFRKIILNPTWNQVYLSFKTTNSFRYLEWQAYI